MTWNDLVQQRRVAPESTSKQELDDLRALVDRNLNDAALPKLSADGRFGMAYDAARTLATAEAAISALSSTEHLGRSLTVNEAGLRAERSGGGPGD